MEQKMRIEKDILMFEKNLKKIKESERFKKISELAIQYYKDSKYYLEKKDYFTAFGCINYAHGLIDGILKL